MLSRLLTDRKSMAYRVMTEVARRVKQWTTPLAETIVGGVVSDATKSKPELIAENALLRQQLIVLKRQVKQVRLKGHERLLLMVLASKVRAWRQALLLVKPETLLGWHRGLFRLVWKRKSATTERQSRVPVDTIALIGQMARDNRLWGAERIQGELRQLGIKLAKRTVQKYMRAVRPSRPHGQTWSTFLKNHAAQIWACDFLPVVDFGFRQLYAFFIIELGTRRVVHFGVTRRPTDTWVAQQLREATPFDEHPTYLIRDNDSKFAEQFARVAADRGIQVLKTPYRAPKANAFCERLLRSVRQECLDYFLIFAQRHLQRLLKEYVAYYNHARPHQGIGQCIPIPLVPTDPTQLRANEVQVIPILGGLHHRYRLAA
jgi:putative transposase